MNEERPTTPISAANPRPSLPQPSPPMLEYRSPDSSQSPLHKGMKLLFGIALAIFSLGILSCLGAMTGSRVAFLLLLGGTIFMLALAASAIRESEDDRLVAHGIWIGMLVALLLLVVLLIAIFWT